MTESIPLFDTAADWQSQPMVAFAAFVKTHQFVELGLRRPAYLKNSLTSPKPLKSSSAKVYLTMFGAFTRWMDAHGVTLFSLKSSDLEEFLAQQHDIDGITVRKLNSAICIRYVRLLERVLTHIGVTPNPAQETCFSIYRQRRSGLSGEDAPKAVLTDLEQRAFMLALPPLPTATSPSHWKRQRDRAMQALMLGAGLKVSEVLALRLDQIGTVDATGSIPINLDAGAANSITRPHRTQLRAFAVNEVRNWQARRIAQGSGNLLFPANPSSNQLLNAATVYRQVKATFERAGIDPKRWGGRTLRNTFAVRELAESGSTELVGEFLGHRLQRSTQYYQELATQRSASGSTHASAITTRRTKK